MVDNSNEAVFCWGSCTFSVGHSLGWDLELQWVCNSFPDLLGAASIVILETFEVEDKNRRERLNENLLSSSYVGSFGRVEITGDAFSNSEVFEGFCDGADLWSLDVELKWGIGFKGDGSFEARNPEFGAEEATEDLGNWGFGDFGGACSDSALFVADFEPAAF